MVVTRKLFIHHLPNTIGKLWPEVQLEACYIQIRVPREVKKLLKSISKDKIRKLSKQDLVLSPVPMMERTKYFLDLWLKLQTIKNSKYCQGIQTPIFSQTCSVFSTKNFRSESARSQNYTERDRYMYSFRGRSNRTYSPLSSKVCIEILPSEEEITWIQTRDKSQEFKSVRSHRALYNGDYYKSKNNVIKG